MKYVLYLIAILVATGCATRSNVKRLVSPPPEPPVVQSLHSKTMPSPKLLPSMAALSQVHPITFAGDESNAKIWTGQMWIEPKWVVFTETTDFKNWTQIARFPYTGGVEVQYTVQPSGFNRLGVIRYEW